MKNIDAVTVLTVFINFSKPLENNSILK